MLSIIQAAGWPIWPLIASSVLALAIVLERLISLTDHKIAPSDLLDKVLAATSQRIPENTAVIELEKSSALGCVLASAFHLLQAHPKASDEDLRETMVRPAATEELMGDKWRCRESSTAIGLLICDSQQTTTGYWPEIG